MLPPSGSPIVWTLSEGLDARAKAYLSKVESEDLVAEYVDYLRKVGAAVIGNAERRSFLSNPYSEDCLRKMAESTGHIIIRRHELTPEQYEAEVRAEVERCRSHVMPAAKEWNEWYCQMLFRIETCFEARYRYWEANAIERAKAGKEGRLAEWFRRVQRELYPDATTDPHARIPDCWKKVLPVSFFIRNGWSAWLRSRTISACGVSPCPPSAWRVPHGGFSACIWSALTIGSAEKC